MSSTNSWNQLGGQTCALGGAVIVQVVPTHVNAGKMIRLFMLFPWVLETAATKEIFIVFVFPECKVTVIGYCPP